MKFRASGLIALWAAVSAMQAPPPAAEPASPDLELWRLDCGEILFAEHSAFFSDNFQYPPGPKKLADSCYLIRNGTRYMIWDTGLPGELAGKSQQAGSLTMSLSSRLTDQLARIGIRPEQIGILGISHYHFDHVGQASDFPQARLLIGREDVEIFRTVSDSMVQPDRIRPWLDGQRELVEVSGDHDVFGDGSVVMLDMPGHTPGHHSLLVRLASGAVLLSGDLYHFTEQVENRGVPSFNHDRADTLASMDRYRSIARNLGARTIIQHEPADIALLPAFPESAR